MFYTIAVFYWACVCLVLWGIWRAVHQRHFLRSLVYSFLLALILMCGEEFQFFPGAESRARAALSREMFGGSFTLGPTRHSYRSSRAFNGDGYSISVVEIPEELVRYAEHPPESFTQHPLVPSYRSQWKGVPWHLTRIGEDEVPLLQFALGESVDDPDLKAAKQLLERLAYEPGNWIAYCHFNYDGRVGDVDFFLLSPKERILIVVNHNT